MNATSLLATKLSIGRRPTVALLIAFVFAILMLPTSVRADEPAQEKSTGGAPFKGTLYLIGGGADSSLQRFVDLAGGANAVVAILPHASSLPQEAADEATNLFAARGVKNIITIMPNQKVGLPKNVNAVYFTGGDQNRLVRLLDPVLAKEIQDFLKSGGLVGGTSAGAAAVPPKMIAGGMKDGRVKKDALLLADGLGYLPGFVIDTHVMERTRHDRLMVALSEIDNVVGIGLDEDTAVEISGKTIKVWGAGHARFMKRSDKFKTTLPNAEKDNKASVFNVLYSVLSENEEWSLE